MTMMPIKTILARKAHWHPHLVQRFYKMCPQGATVGVPARQVSGSRTVGSEQNRAPQWADDNGAPRKP